jgi:hypothetical protein
VGKRIIRAFGWVLSGCIGSIVIFVVAAAFVQTMVPVSLPMLTVSTRGWGEYVSARGTWTMDNDKPAFPLQTSEITCRRYNMTCISAQAEVFRDMLNVELYDYEVTRWDSDVILFKNTSSNCVDYTYTINRVNQRVIGTRTTKKTKEDGCLADISTKPINLTLTDGFKVYWQLHEEAQAKVFPFGWMAFAVWWVFVCLRIWNGGRASASSLHRALASPRTV